MFPDFVGIGAQKAGTTWLHRNLQAHPGVYMPRKELHYFDRKANDPSNALTRLFGRGELDARWRRQVRHWAWVHLVKRPSLRDLRWDLNFYMRPYNDAWYASVFEGKGGRVAGEITPAYSTLDRQKVERIHGLMPDTKVIFFMRNPIERVWSQIVMSFDKKEKGSAPSVPVEQLLERRGLQQIGRLSNYRRTLENWGEFYPEEQVFVGFLEDVHFAPAELLSRLYAFLGVDPTFVPPRAEKKVHSRSAATMPTRIAVELARNYREELEGLAERFGGYASFWLHCAQRLAEDPPEEEAIAYPLYKSFLWEEWAGGDGAGPRQTQSGPLTSIQVGT